MSSHVPWSVDHLRQRIKEQDKIFMTSQNVDALCDYEKANRKRRGTLTREREQPDANSSRSCCYFQVWRLVDDLLVSHDFSAFSYSIVTLSVIK